MFALPIGFFNSPQLPSQKTLHIYMLDTYGDGWNGNYIDILNATPTQPTFDNFASSLTSFPLAGKSDGEIKATLGDTTELNNTQHWNYFSTAIDSSITYTLRFYIADNSWPEEIGFVIYLNDSNVLQCNPGEYMSNFGGKQVDITNGELQSLEDFPGGVWVPPVIHSNQFNVVSTDPDGTAFFNFELTEIVYSNIANIDVNVIDNYNSF